MKNKIQYAAMICLLIGSAQQITGMNFFTPSYGTSMERLEMDLFDAIRENDESEAIRLIKNGGIDFNVRNGEGKTFFYETIQTRQDNIIRALIDAGADVNFKNIYENTPLRTALLYRRHEPIIQTLIDAGADVNIANGYNGETLLSTLIKDREQQLPMIQALITAGADTTKRDRNGVSPLLNATLANKTDIIPVLVAAGANINETTDHARLVYGQDVREHQAPIGSSMLHLAIKRESLPMIQTLIDNNINVNTQDSQQNNGLSLAIAEQSVPIVQTLINSNRLHPADIEDSYRELDQQTNLTPAQNQIKEILYDNISPVELH